MTIHDLAKLYPLISASSIEVGGKTINAAMLIKGTHSGEKKPLLILAQLHGNEPAGLAGIMLALALAQAKLLQHDVIGMIGNPLAAEQYFSAYSEAPGARQEIRDAFRCGLGEGGVLLPDMNRIPVDFLTREPTNHHIRRAQELYSVGSYVRGVLDIHTARGNMLCITDHKKDSELKNSPIRAVLLGLADAISAHSSSQAVTVKTLKTILQDRPNIDYQVGIEAGRHEAPDSPKNAALFTLSFLHGTGATAAAPKVKKETGLFECYHVQPKWNYADLKMTGSVEPDDKIYMAIPCLSIPAIPKRSDRVIVKKPDGCYMVQTIMQYMVKPAGEIEFAVYQYDEMELLAESAVVAVAVPSGVAFKAPASVSGIFFSKSAALYSQDPAVGPWPVPAAKIDEIKFCYPCIVKHEKLSV